MLDDSELGLSRCLIAFVTMYIGEIGGTCFQSAVVSIISFTSFVFCNITQFINCYSYIEVQIF